MIQVAQAISSNGTKIKLYRLAATDVGAFFSLAMWRTYERQLVAIDSNVGLMCSQEATAHALHDPVIQEKISTTNCKNKIYSDAYLEWSNFGHLEALQ